MVRGTQGQDGGACPGLKFSVSGGAPLEFSGREMTQSDLWEDSWLGGDWRS